MNRKLHVRKGFTLIELIMGVACFAIIGYILVQASNAIWFRKMEADDSSESYESITEGIDILDGPISNIGVGMVSNRARINDDGTITKKPFDEFRVSWLGGSWRDSPAPARMMQHSFSTADGGDVGDGPVTILNFGGSDELWFAFGLPTEIYVKSVSRNRKLEGIGNERVPLSSAYININGIKNPNNSNYGGPRYAKYMYLKGYWNDGSDSVVLGISDIGLLRNRYHLEPGATGADSGGPDEEYMKSVVEKFSFVENRMSVLQEPHPILSSVKLASLNSWLLLGNFRVPIAVEKIYGDRITCKPAPGAYFYKQIMSGASPSWNYTMATGSLLGGYLGVGDKIFMPRMGRVYLQKNTTSDTIGGTLWFEVCARTKSGTPPICDTSEPGYEQWKLADGIAGILWDFDPESSRLTAKIAAVGKESGMTSAIATGVPVDWDKTRSGVFTHEELQHRIFVRTRSWNLMNF